MQARANICIKVGLVLGVKKGACYKNQRVLSIENREKGGRREKYEMLQQPGRN